MKPADGKVNLAVKLTLPEGWKINPLAPMSYRIEASDAGVIDAKALGKSTKVAEPATNFDIALPVTAASGEDKVKVSLTYYYCREGAEGLCKMASAVWTVPVTIDPAAAEAAVTLEAEAP